MTDLATRGTAARPVDAHAVRSHLAVLTETWEPSWWLVVGAKSPSGHLDRHTWLPASDIDQAVELLVELAASTDTYVAVQPQAARRGLGERSTSSNVAALTALVVEIDTADGVHRTPNVAATAADARASLARCPLQPSLVVHSGGGLHAWWMLAEPIDADLAPVLLARWRRWWEQLGLPGVDAVVAGDAARILRPAGTLNHKGPVPVAVRAVEANALRYSLDDLDELLPAVAVESGHTFTPPADGSTDPFDVLLGHPDINAAVASWLVGLPPPHGTVTGWEITRQGRATVKLGRPLRPGERRADHDSSVLIGGHTSGRTPMPGATTPWSTDPLVTDVLGPAFKMMRASTVYARLFTGGDLNRAKSLLAGQGIGTWPPASLHALVGQDCPPAATTPAAAVAGGDGGKATKKSIAAELVEIAEELYDLGLSDTGEAFAVARGGPRLARMLRGGQQSLRAELAAAFHQRTGRIANSGALADSLLVIEGRAQAAAPIELGLRVAVTSDHHVVIDLGDPTGRCVIITPAGWAIATQSPVLFRRTRLTHQLPDPQPGGRLDELRRYVNVTDDAWPLLVAWMVAALLPDRPTPMLLFKAEQGAGKSTTGRFVVALVDPVAAPLRSTPDSPQDWGVTAAASRVVGLDNLSTISEWLSDALCRAVTGDGFARRALYTDADLSVITLRRALLATTIDAGSLRGDLADRVIAVELDRIEPHQRLEDAELASGFDEARPRILAGLYDLVAQVLAALPHVRPAQLPRMADFGRLLAAVDHVLGTSGLATYMAASANLAAELVDGDPVADALRSFATSKPWRGTAAELLRWLTPDGPRYELPRAWPKDPKALSGILRRLAPALRDVGVSVDLGRTNGVRWIEVAAVPQAPSACGTGSALDAVCGTGSALFDGDETPGSGADSAASAASAADRPFLSVPPMGEEEEGIQEGAVRHLRHSPAPGAPDDPDRFGGLL